MTGEQAAHHDIVMMKVSQGNSRAYTLARLKRERPDLFQRVKAKAITANAAAIETGYAFRGSRHPCSCGEPSALP